MACATPDAPRLRAFAKATHGDLTLVGGGSPARSGELAVLRADGSEVARAIVAEDLVYGVAIHPSGARCACACADGRVLLLDFPSLANAQALHAHAGVARVVAFTPDGAKCVSGGRDTKLLLTDLGTRRTVEVVDHTAGVECLAFAPDGALWSGAIDGKVRVHDPASGRLVRTFARLGGKVERIELATGAECAVLGDGRRVPLTR